MGIWTPSNICFLGPIRVHSQNGNWIGSDIFAQLTPECSPGMLGHALPPQNCPFPWEIWTPWFLGPTRVLNQNSISIGSTSVVFAGLTTVTGFPTDRSRYLAGNNRPHLRM